MARAGAARLGDRPVDTVFLDRDGTLNRKAPDGEYVRRPAELALLAGAGAAVARLNRAGVRTVLVTNQRWLARPDALVADYRATHERLVALLAAAGARLDAAYHCPHERGVCDCRKPAPGMLRRAALEHGIDLGRAVIIGDAASDLAAGRAAGTGTMLIGRPGVAGVPVADVPAADVPDADATVADLWRAVGVLLGDVEVPAQTGRG